MNLVLPGLALGTAPMLASGRSALLATPARQLSGQVSAAGPAACVSQVCRLRQGIGNPQRKPQRCKQPANRNCKSSRLVKNWYRRSRPSPRSRGEIPHRQKHAQRQHQHHHAHTNDKNRLDGVGQLLKVVVDFLLVEVGDLDEQPSSCRSTIRLRCARRPSRASSLLRPSGSLGAPSGR